jgi:hypothetical protein
MARQVRLAQRVSKAPLARLAWMARLAKPV